MKILKRCMALVMICAVVMCNSRNVQAKSVTMYGFVYDDEVQQIEWKKSRTVSAYTDAGYVIGSIEYYVGLAKTIGHNDYYTLMIKMQVIPNANAIKKMDGSIIYGLSEYASVKTTVPGNLTNFQPTEKYEDNCKNGKLTINMGLDKGGLSLGASYDITTSDLDIIAKSYPYDELYCTIYDYKPSLINPFAKNEYVKNSSEQFCMAEFVTDKKEHTFYIDFECRFGASSSSSRSPWSIYNGYIMKNSVRADYRFLLK